VHVPGDSGALAIDGLLAFQLGQPAADLAERDEPDTPHAEQHGGGPGGSAEPQRLPEEWRHPKGQAGAGFIPDAVIVAREDVEAVFARLQSVEGGEALRATVDPAVVPVLQPVAEPHLARRGEAEGGEVEFDPPGTRRNHRQGGGLQGERPAVHPQLLDHDGRRQGVEGHRLRIG
jgi:hypothetical protein